MHFDSCVTVIWLKSCSEENREGRGNLGNFFLDNSCWIYIYIYIYIYIDTHQQRFFGEKQWTRIRKRRHLLPWLLNFLGPIKESSSSSGIFGSIFVPSTKVLALISVQFCCFELMFRIYKFVMYFLWLFQFDFHWFYFVMFVCFQ